MDRGGGLAKRIPARLSAKEGRKFGFTLGMAFLVFGGIAWWRDHETISYALWAIAGLLLVAGLFFPTRLGPVQRVWMGMAHAISKVTTPIFMGIMYFVVFAPMGAVMRLFGHNSLTTHHGGDSAWVPRAAGQQSDLERQF